jgi:hypothetical protein
MARTTTARVRDLYKTHSEEHREKREESAMRGITVGVTLAIVALVAGLCLPTQRVGAQQAEKFDLEKAIAGAKTPADHEAIASYYAKESATAKDKAAEHRKLAQTYRTLTMPGRVQFPMENHCQQLAQTYESVAADNAALAEAHRQMAQEAAQKKQ